MADELKPGDVVRLKSGGPEMTVEAARESAACCIWFTMPMLTAAGEYRSEVLHRQSFGVATLMRHNPAAASNPPEAGQPAQPLARNGEGFIPDWEKSNQLVSALRPDGSTVSANLTGEVFEPTTIDEAMTGVPGATTTPATGQARLGINPVSFPPAVIQRFNEQLAAVWNSSPPSEVQPPRSSRGYEFL